MLRVSTTTLESFRRVIDTQYGSESELFASVQGKPFAPNANMQAGTAWHSILEEPQRWQKSEQRASGEIDIWYECGGFRFSPLAVGAAIDAVGNGQWEVKATRVFETPHGPATLVAKADHVHGKVVTDNKTVFSTVDARKYESSVQWRSYLAVHGADCFRYVLYDFSEPKDGYCELRDIVQFRFWPYRDLEADVMRWLNLFLSWCDSRGLMNYLHRAGTS